MDKETADQRVKTAERHLATAEGRAERKRRLLDKAKDERAKLDAEPEPAEQPAAETADEPEPDAATEEA